MKFKIELTWSKLVALIIVGCAFYLDFRNGGFAAFSFSLPFVVFLITGKQFFDNRKAVKEMSNGGAK